MVAPADLRNNLQSPSPTWFRNVGAGDLHHSADASELSGTQQTFHTPMDFDCEPRPQMFGIQAGADQR